jgi:hypothetical protein
MQTIRLENAFTDLVVSLEEIKQHLIVEHDDDDVLITRYVLAALDFAEQRTERTFRLRRFRTFGSHWPHDGVHLLNGPVRQVETVQYIDTDGLVETMPTDTWQVLPYNGGHRLSFYEQPPYTHSAAHSLPHYPSAAWPVYGRQDTVSVTYLAGYGLLPDTTADLDGFPYTLPIVLGQSAGGASDVNNVLPTGIRQAVYMLVGHWYENRESVAMGTTVSDVPMATDSLLQQQRVYGV